MAAVNRLRGRLHEVQRSTAKASVADDDGWVCAGVHVCVGGGCRVFLPGACVSDDVSLEAVGRRLASAGSSGVFGQRAQRPHAMDGWGVHGCYVVRWRSGAAVMCGGDALLVEK